MKFILSIVIVVFCIAAFVGSTNQVKIKTGPSSKKVKTVAPVKRPVPAYGEGIPIIAWIGVPQNQTNLAAYQEMSAAGITYSYYPFSDISAMDKALDLAQKTNIKLFIACPELTTNTEATVKHFMNNPATAGYFIKDEPGGAGFKDLALIVKKIKAVDSKHICYINLLPNYATNDQLGANSYPKYLSRYLTEVPVDVLSFDHYPIIGTGRENVRAEWYNNLEMVSAAAKRANIPFWAFSLSMSFSPYPVPTLPMLRLQVYSNLAYGAQAIQYFTYLTLYDPAVGNFNNGPISKEYVKTPVYPIMQQMNKEIHGLSSVFAGARVVSVGFTGPIPAGTKHLGKLPRPIKMLTTSGVGAVVSVMENHGNSYLVIVNRDFTANMKLTIKTGGEVSTILKNGSSVAQPQGIKTVQVEPGDVAIYKWTGK
jgi:hypothetical protein